MNRELADILLKWYADNRRDLPWRSSRDPYLVWISEIILQQTRVSQGLAYYNRFAGEFPTVFHLARASEPEVLKCWQGLGYYSRARNLHKTSKLVAEKYHGQFPSTPDELIKLPGIGRYTAAAIASIAFGEPVPVVDGNVIRVISRLFGITGNSRSPSVYRMIHDTMKELMGNLPPGIFNQSVMEFGALQCTPLSPGCRDCPLQAHCFAFARQMVEQLPAKPIKPVVSIRYFNYLVISVNKDGVEVVLLNKRTGKDIWHNLYDFPSVENDRLIDPEELAVSKEIRELLGEEWTLQHVAGPVIHLLTHRKIIARFFRIHVKHETPAMKRYRFTSIQDIRELPLPRLIEKYIGNHFPD